MFCEKCGNPVGLDDVFCHNCGHKQRMDNLPDITNAPPLPVVSSVAPSASPSYKMKTRMLLIVPVSVVLVGLIIGLVVFLATSNAPSGNVAPTASPSVEPTPSPTEKPIGGTYRYKSIEFEHDGSLVIEELDDYVLLTDSESKSFVQISAIEAHESLSLSAVLDFWLDQFETDSVEKTETKIAGLDAEIATYEAIKNGITIPSQAAVFSDAKWIYTVTYSGYADIRNKFDSMLESIVIFPISGDDISDFETETSSSGGIWQQLYIDEINEHRSEFSWTDEEGMEPYALIYLDDDDMPELVIGTPGRSGDTIYTVSDGELDSVSPGFISYMERGNLVYGGYFGTVYFHETIYTIENGKFRILHEGAGDATDANGNYTENYKHTWNGENVSESEYQKRLNAAFDDTKAISFYDLDYESADGIIKRGGETVAYGLFFRAVSETLLELCADKKHLGAKPGITTVLHTWGQNLGNYTAVLTRWRSWRLMWRMGFCGLAWMIEVDGFRLYLHKFHRKTPAISTETIGVFPFIRLV